MNCKVETIGAFWHQRKQSLEECSNKLLTFLLLLKGHNPVLFGNWYKKGRSLQDAQKNEISLTLENMIDLLSKKRGGYNFSEEGFCLGLWTGNLPDEESSALSVNIGSFSPYIKNSCVLKLPYEGGQAKYYSQTENQIDLIQQFNLWEPSWIEINGEKKY